MPLPYRIARWNKALTNRVIGRFADRLPGCGILIHRGRRSGTVYRTPVNVLTRDGGFVFALTYGRGDWVRNVLAAGSGQLITRRRHRRFDHPRIEPYRSDAGFPLPVRGILRLIHVDEMLVADESPETLDAPGDGG